MAQSTPLFTCASRGFNGDGVKFPARAFVALPRRQSIQPLCICFDPSRFLPIYLLLQLPLLSSLPSITEKLAAFPWHPNTSLCSTL